MSFWFIVFFLLSIHTKKFQDFLLDPVLYESASAFYDFYIKKKKRFIFMRQIVYSDFQQLSV